MSWPLFGEPDGPTLTDVIAALDGTPLAPTALEKLYRLARDLRICVSYKAIFRELEAQGYVLAHKAHANGHNRSVGDALASMQRR